MRLKKYAVYLLVLAMILVSCQSKTSENTSTTGAEAPTGGAENSSVSETDPEAEIEKEIAQVLNIGSPNDPMKKAEAQTLFADTLVHISADHEVVPNLAKSWEVSDDFKEYRFELVSDVKFSDGTDLTGEDVKKSLTLLAEVYWGGYSYSIDSVEVDGSTLTMTFTNPQMYLFEDLAKVPVYKADAIAEDGTITDYIGTGPYMLESYEPNVKGHFVKNPYYWNKEKESAIEEINWIVLEDPEAINLALESGGIDVIGIGEHWPSISKEALAAYREEGKYSIVDLNPEHYTIVMGQFFNWKSGPCSDVNLRKAIVHAIDRQEMVDILFYGEAKPSGRYQNPFFDDGPKEEEEYQYDLELSKKALEDGGYVLEDGVVTKDGEQVVLKYVIIGMPSQIDLATYIQNALKNIGLTVEIQMCEKSVAFDEMEAGNYDITGIGHALYEPLVSSITYNGMDPKYGKMGLGFGVSEEAIAAGEQFLTAKDKQEISDFAKEYWTILYDSYCYLPLYTNSKSAVYSKNFTGFKFSGSVFHIDLTDVKKIAE